MNKKTLIYAGIGLIIILGGLYIYSKRKKPIIESNNSNSIYNFNSSITDTPEWSAAK